jgi:PAS domain S-box-containing protein
MMLLKPSRPRVRPSWYQIGFFALFGPVVLAGAALWLGTEMKRGVVLRQQISTSLETQRQLAELFSLLKDAETGQRGYLISGDRTFLEPYEKATARLDRQVARVDQLTPDVGPDARDLEHLKSLIRDKFAEMDAVIRVRESAGLLPAAERLKLGRGKQLMDQIRIVITGIERRDDRQLQAVQQAEAQRVKKTRRALWTIITAFAIVAGVLGFLIGRGMRLRNLLALENEGLSARRKVVFDSVSDAIVIINPSGTIEKVNQSAERMFGWRDEHLWNRDISTLADIAPGEGSFLERLGMREGRLDRAELIDITARNSNGEAVPVDIVLGTMPLSDGIHIVAAMRDATARKEVDRLKDDFISTVSHELRTPLTSVVGSLGLLRSGAAGNLPPQAQRLAEIAETNSQRLIRLINDILDIDQIQKGRMAFDYAVIDLRDVMSKTLEAMQGLADRRPVSIDMRMPDDPVVACADADRLVQVAGNLLSNAIKFSPEDSTITFELFPGREDHLIQITDQGPGVDPDFANQIFNRFAQGGRPDRQMIAGTGLGLAISREIVRNHGGDISFENRSEGGARFAFSIPRDSAQVVEGARSVRLLICEDDSDAGFTVQSILTAHGFASDLVTTVRDAIAHARNRPYNAVLLDLTLADANGTELIRALRADSGTKHLPIVIISGTAPNADIDSDAYVGWLQKPFDPPRLIQLIQRAILHAGQRKAVILHVDDDNDTRELFAAALAGRGLLLSATSLASARTILAARRPDAIVLDLGLPDGSGRDLLAEIKQGEHPLPVIVYSAQEIDGRTRSLADAVIVKSRRALPKLATNVLEVVEQHGGPQ